MLKIYIMLLLTAQLFSATDLKKVWNNMYQEQRESIYQSYEAGVDYNLGYTLAAINWQESVGGVYQISMDYHDFGIYHINIKWYLRGEKIKDTMWNRSKYSTFILTHPKVSEIYVISKLQNILRSNGNNFYKTWWKYNGSKVYAKDIHDKVIFLKKVFKLKYEEK